VTCILAPTLTLRAKLSKKLRIYFFLKLLLTKKSMAILDYWTRAITYRLDSVEGVL